MCFFPRKFATSPSAALGCYWLYKNYQPIGVTVHSYCVESFEGLLQRCRRGRVCNELWKNTIFPEHPVSKYTCNIFIYVYINSGYFKIIARLLVHESHHMVYRLGNNYGTPSSEYVLSRLLRVRTFARWPTATRTSR